MSIKTAMLCVALGIGAGLVPSLGSARAYIDVEVAPPPPREEVIPEPRHGYVWAPGYWNWSGHRHVWVRGHWVHERHGHRWVGAQWREHDHHWRFEAGHWE